MEAELPFQAKHLEGFLAPIQKELERAGASQYCQQVRCGWINNCLTPAMPEVNFRALLTHVS